MHRAVRDACLWLPEAEEFLSHGAPNFRVRNKTFATYVVNHHGDGRVALWLNAARGAQESWVGSDARRFFVPPYVGSRGWLGVRLDCGLSWKRIAALVREAYENVAPATLSSALGKTTVFKGPARMLTEGELDPMKSRRGVAILKIMRASCLRLPETKEARQFGYPVWQAGTRTFAWARRDDQGFCVGFWVGVERQQLMTLDARFRIPPYMGHNGWIALGADDHCDAGEVAALAVQSYRHFALQRMLRSLPT
jgi:predicted DNA-binding protein (MmcQ/YjbR family)